MSDPVLLPVNEIFGPTIQGEGFVIGRRSMFVRFAYCDYQCTWCDTKYSWVPELMTFERMTPDQIVEHLVSRSRCRWITLTGGNPAIHNLAPLLSALKDRPDPYHVNLETQGSIARDWFALCDLVTLSPKPPSSGMPTDWEKLASCIALAHNAVLKIVVLDWADYEFARQVHRRYPHLPLALQVCSEVGQDNAQTLLAKCQALAERVLRNDAEWGDVLVLPQLHVLLWGNRRGV